MQRKDDAPFTWSGVENYQEAHNLVGEVARRREAPEETDEPFDYEAARLDVQIAQVHATLALAAATAMGAAGMTTADRAAWKEVAADHGLR